MSEPMTWTQFEHWKAFVKDAANHHSAVIAPLGRAALSAVSSYERMAKALNVAANDLDYLMFGAGRVARAALPPGYEEKT